MALDFGKSLPAPPQPSPARVGAAQRHPVAAPVVHSPFRLVVPFPRPRFMSAASDAPAPGGLSPDRASPAPYSPAPPTPPSPSPPQAPPSPSSQLPSAGAGTAHSRSSPLRSPDVGTPATEPPLTGLALPAAAVAPDVDAENPEARPPPCVTCAQIATAPTVRLDRPRLDRTLIHDSLQSIQASLRQVEEALAHGDADIQLEAKHTELQRAHVAALRHSNELHRQIDTSTSAVQSLAHRCQERQDWLLNELQLSNSLLVSRNLDVEALEERVAAADKTREEMDRLRATSDATTPQLRDRVASLEAQIAAVTNHPEIGPVPPPALARRLQTQDQELLRLRRASQATQQRCAALEQSESALEEAVGQLRGQIDSQNRRIARLREERDSLQASLREAQRQVARVEEMRQMETERHLKRRTELHDLQIHVDSMRSNTAHLEQQLTHWIDTSHIAGRLLVDAQRELERFHQTQDAVSASYQSLHSSYTEAFTRYSSVAAAMGQAVELPEPSSFTMPGPSAPAASGETSATPPASSEPPTSARARKTQKTSSAPRRGAPSRSRSPPRKRLASSRSSRRVVLAANVDVEASASEVEVRDAATERPDTSSRRLLLTQGANAAQGGSDNDDEGFEEESRAALSRSRSERRRSSGVAIGSSNQPIDLSSAGAGDSPGSSPDESSEGEGATGDHPPQDASKAPRGVDAGSEDGREETNQDQSPDPSRASPLVPRALQDSTPDPDSEREEEIENAEHAIAEVDDASLRPTTVPRTQWIPGYRQLRPFRQSEVIPWDCETVSHLRVAEIDVRVLGKLLVNVSEWLFPEVDPESHPHPSTYEHLITGAAIEALLAAGGFVDAYLDFEQRHFLALWESTHFFPISDAMMLADPQLAAYYETRRQRRSRAGVAWRKFLQKHVIPALRLRRCDLDILLDPFFLHFPKPRDLKEWFPRVEDDTQTLADALEIVDREEPWRIQFRQQPSAHPAMQIARLPDKFLIVQ